MIGIFGGKKNNVKSFRRSSKTFNRAFMIEIITDDRIGLEGTSLLMFRFIELKRAAV